MRPTYVSRAALVCCGVVGVTSALAAEPYADALAIAGQVTDNPEGVRGADAVVQALARDPFGSGSAFSTPGRGSVMASGGNASFSYTASGSAGYQLTLLLEGPAAPPLSGVLRTSFKGGGVANSQIGERGSISVGTISYSFRTVGGSHGGAFNIASQAGVAVLTSGGGIQGVGLTNTAQGTVSFAKPSPLVHIKTRAGTFTVEPTAEDWLRWQLPEPAGVPIGVKELASQANATRGQQSAIAGAVATMGIAGLSPEDLRGAVISVGWDVNWTFDLQTDTEIRLAPGRSNTFIANVGTVAGGNAGASASVSASIGGGLGNSQSFQAISQGPWLSSVSSPDLAALSFVVTGVDQAYLDQFKLRVDGTNWLIPITAAVPELPSQLLMALGLAAVIVHRSRSRRPIRR